MSPVQAAMLYRALQDAGAREASGFNVIQIHITLDETLDPTRLAAAFGALLEHHPLLGSGLVMGPAGEPRFRVQSGARVPVAVVPLPADAEARADARAAWLAQDRRSPFTLERAPLMRLHVLRPPECGDELVWTFHHILFDGQNFAPLLDEAFDVYDGWRRARPVAPAPSLADWLGAQERSAALGMFRALLAGVEQATPAPLAEPRTVPERPERLRYASTRRPLAPRTCAALKAFARGQGSSLSSLCLAAWAIVLARHTGEHDLLFGAARSLRERALGDGQHGAVGVFVNTLPVRVRITPEGTLADLLAQLDEQRKLWTKASHVHLVDVRAAAGLPSGAPLFESLLTVDPSDLGSALRGTGKARWQAASCTVHEQPEVPLAVFASGGAEPSVRLQYDRHLYDSQTAERLLDAFATVLPQLLREDLPLADVEVLDADAQRMLLVGFNQTHRPFPPEELLHSRFLAQAAVRPEAPALQCGDELLSYAELEARCRALAQRLCAAGASPGSRVAICLGRSTELVIAMLSVSMCGAAYVPIDPAYPDARIDFMWRDASCAVLLTDRRSGARFGRLGLGAVCVYADGAEAAPSMPLPTPVDPGELAYIIYTSGSTGAPNGVAVTHHAATNTLDWVNRTFGVLPTDRLLFVTSPCFDLSVYDVFGTLGAGACVVVAREAELADPERLRRLMTERAITIWDSAPAALQIALSGAPAPLAGGGPRLVMLSGDWVPLGLPALIRRMCPRAALKVLGGATEAAIWSNWFDVHELDPRWRSIPYGRPIQNARYHVLDARMKPVPIGVRGQLYIGGLCLARGYENRPELTARRFVADPFSPGERLYNTGDLARYMPDGNLEFLGRNDHQIKVRGFRVELGEVESALATASGVREAVCGAYADSAGQKALCGYLVLDGATRFDEAALRTELAQRLPEYMVPSRFVLLDTLPVTANGKIDRKALPAPNASPTAGSTPLLEAADDLELRLHALWLRLLQRADVGVTQSFFALGGHSLLVLTLLQRVHLEFTRDVPLPAFLKDPTIRGMAKVLAGSDDVVRHSSSLHVYNARGSERALVLVGAGHFMLLYRELAKLFSRDQPVYLLQSGRADTHDSAQLAAEYAAELAAAGLSSPFALGGFGRGADVALALCARLRAAGHEPSAFVCFDPALVVPRAADDELGPLARAAEQAERAVTGLARRIVRGPPPPSHRALAEGYATRLGMKTLLVESDGGDDPDAAIALDDGGDLVTLRVAGRHMAFLGSETRAELIAALERMLRAL